MKIIEGVKVILADPGYPHSTQIIAKIRNSDANSIEEFDLTNAMLVQWPIDIHIDSEGAIVTLKMRASELEVKCGVVKVVESVKPFVEVICSANAEHRATTQFHAHGSRCDFGGAHNGIWMRIDMLTMDDKP